MKRLLLLTLLLLASDALAATAYLVSQRQAQSVTGRFVLVCTYAYGTQYFERTVPMETGCPQSIDIE